MKNFRVYKKWFQNSTPPSRQMFQKKCPTSNQLKKILPQIFSTQNILTQKFWIEDPLK